MKKCRASTIGQVGEFGLISALFPAAIRENERVVRSIGDDAAAVRISENRLLLATCDIQIEGIHFVLDRFSPEQIGWRAGAVNLSDIAAMGGYPRFALISLALPASMEVEFVQKIYQGLAASLHDWSAVIIGGNTAALPERLVIDVTLLGEVDESCMLRRDGAQPGDAVCITGSLGAARAGLMILKDPDLNVSEAHKKEALAAHQTPSARVAEGLFLGRAGSVTACIDVSDGLLQDAGHLAEQSNVTVYIEADLVPVATCASDIAHAAAADALTMAVSGGEDFELLFTLPKRSVDACLADMASETGTRVHVIGEVREGGSRMVMVRNGIPMDLTSPGFDHFVRQSEDGRR